MPEWKPTTADAPYAIIWGDTVETCTKGPDELVSLIADTYRKDL